MHGVRDILGMFVYYIWADLVELLAFRDGLGFNKNEWKELPWDNLDFNEMRSRNSLFFNRLPAVLLL